MGIRLRYSHKRVIQQSRIGDLYREVSTISLSFFSNSFVSFLYRIQ